jgi:hypothetical protein
VFFCSKGIEKSYFQKFVFPKNFFMRAGFYGKIIAARINNRLSSLLDSIYYG